MNKQTQVKRDFKPKELVHFDRVLETRVMILTYDPDDDTISIDADGLSGLELREMIRMAYDKILVGDPE